MAGIEIRERAFDYGPQRGSWIVKVSIEAIIEAVKIQLEYHERRLALWKRRRGIAAGKERRSIKTKEVQVTGGTQTMYESDPNATAAKQLAERKIVEHQAQVDGFREWVAFLEMETEDRDLPLAIEDAKALVLSNYTPKER